MKFSKKILENKKEQLENVIGLIVVFIIIIVIFTFILLMSLGLLKILGFKYDNNIVLFKFVLMYVIIGEFLELVLKAFSELFSSIDSIKNKLFRFLNIMKEIVLLGFLNLYIDGLEISFLTALLYALFINLGEDWLDKNSNN